MRRDWVERLHDQARAELGFCVQDGRIWCSRHDSGKVPGEEACNLMQQAYNIAESAGEVMGELVATELVAQASEWNDNAVPAVRVRGAARIAKTGALMDQVRSWLLDEERRAAGAWAPVIEGADPESNVTHILRVQIDQPYDE